MSRGDGGSIQATYPATDGFKRCSKCGETKPVSEFYHHFRQSDGYVAKCKDCMKSLAKQYTANRDTVIAITSEMTAEELEAALKRNAKVEVGKEHRANWRREYAKANQNHIEEMQRERKLKNPDIYSQRARRRNLKKSYGLTPDKYEKLVSRQNGRCAICGCQPEKPLYVDHNHDTGVIRGLLCGHCNFAIGQFKDSTEIIMSAIAYLERPRSVLVQLPLSIDNPLELAA